MNTVSTRPRGDAGADNEPNTVSSERYRWQPMATISVPYQEVTNSTGRVFRTGETPRQILGYNR
jgi:hypothetical protein